MNLLESMHITQIKQICILPGGKALCETMQASHEHKKSLSRLDLFDPGNNRKTVVLEPDATPSLFCRIGQKPFLGILRGQDFCVKNLSDNKERHIANLPFTAQKLEASADGRMILFTAKDFTAEQKQLIAAGIIIQDEIVPVQLFSLELNSGKVTQISNSSTVKSSAKWSPDGQRIVFLEHSQEEYKNPALAALKIINSDGSGEKILLGGKVRCGSPRWSPDGKYIAYTRRRPYRFTNDKLAVVAAAGGAEKILTANLDRSVAQLQWRDNQNIIFRLPEGVYSNLLEASLENASIKRITEAEGIIDFDICRESQEIIYSAANFNAPPELYKMGLNGTKKRQISAFNDYFRQQHVYKVELAYWKNNQNQVIEGILTRADDRKGKPALIVDIHGGTPSAFTSRSIELYQHQYNAHIGISSLIVNYRGSCNYGRKFMESLFGFWTTGPAEDCIMGAEHLIKKQAVDPGRIGITGASGGGMIGGAAIGLSDIFTVAVLGCGWYNFASLYHGAFFENIFDLMLGGPPLEFPEAYRTQSPLTYAGNVKTPALLWCGENDPVAPINQSEQFYAMLKRNNIPLEFIRYQNEGHGIHEYKRKVDLLQRGYQWFSKYLNTKIKGKA